ADGMLLYANPAAHALCRNYPRDLDHGLTLGLLVPDGALPQAREEGHWTGHLCFGQGSMLLVHLYYAEQEGGHFLVLMQDLQQIRAYDQDLLRRHAELNVRLTAAQEKLLQA